MAPKLVQPCDSESTTAPPPTAAAITPPKTAGSTPPRRGGSVARSSGTDAAVRGAAALSAGDALSDPRALSSVVGLEAAGDGLALSAAVPDSALPAAAPGDPAASGASDFFVPCPGGCFGWDAAAPLAVAAAGAFTGGLTAFAVAPWLSAVADADFAGFFAGAVARAGVDLAEAGVVLPLFPLAGGFVDAGFAASSPAALLSSCVLARFAT
jgi:hypothetical protein